MPLSFSPLIETGLHGPWMFLDSQTQKLVASLDDSPRPIFIPVTEFVVTDLRHNGVYQVCVAARNDSGWGRWSESVTQHLKVLAPPKFCTSGDFTTTEAFVSYSEALLRPGMPVKCREAYHGKARDVEKGAAGVLQQTQGGSYPPALVAWEGEEPYWVTFRNLELDVDAFEAGDIPDLGRALDLAELAIGALGQAMQEMIEYKGYNVDGLLEEGRKKKLAATP
jgi:hypothetical protein